MKSKVPFSRSHFGLLMLLTLFSGLNTQAQNRKQPRYTEGKR